MFGVKVVALLALALVVSATDLEDGLAIMACARRAINGGVPELNIPSHDPYVVIKHNFSWSGDIGVLLTNAKINFHDMTWAGLGTWELKATQQSKDVDKNAVFEFELWWRQMEMGGKYDAVENSGFIHQEQHGGFSMLMKDTAWRGSIDLTKPNEQSNGTVNSVKIDWDVKDLDITIDGLGLIDRPVAATLATAFKAGLNNHLIRNAVGDFIKMRLETIWWNTGKVWDLVQWCKDHPATSTDY
ncbi:unnamed protein product [Psylliodes chrysocephalus]|uniref:Uncharacterized protein n=1 Tax=Psylliodes chrysocephalus TaxID=3402493 RepID=A0A9P0G453_9CUCU|nr:unnamed protein product [Psylliodes chrysocephala]